MSLGPVREWKREIFLSSKIFDCFRWPFRWYLNNHGIERDGSVT